MRDQKHNHSASGCFDGNTVLGGRTQERPLLTLNPSGDSFSLHFSSQSPIHLSSNRLNCQFPKPSVQTPEPARVHQSVLPGMPPFDRLNLDTQLVHMLASRATAARPTPSRTPTWYEISSACTTQACRDEAHHPTRNGEVPSQCDATCISLGPLGNERREGFSRLHAYIWNSTTSKGTTV